MPTDEKLWQIRPRAWRSLDELEGRATPDPEEIPEALSRRSFLQLVGASTALAAAGCDRAPPEKILPFSVQPPDVTPGVPRDYATHALRDGFAVGLVVRSNDGRPTKVEGNAAHPGSLGGSGRFEQALVLSLYDPDRAGNVRHNDDPIPWTALFAELRHERKDRGAKLRILMEPTTSPTLARLLARAREIHPELRVTSWAPLDAAANTLEGAKLAFGRALLPQLHLDRADVIVSLDDDLLDAGPFALHHARRWSARRRSAARPNRLYAMECMPSPTGLSADHRLRCRSGEIAQLARALAQPGFALVLDDDMRHFVAAVTHDLQAHPRGTTLVTVGERQPPAVHALGHALNHALGNLGATVTFIEPPLAVPSDQDLAALTGELRAGSVDTLLILDGNPVLTAPGFAAALAQVAERIYLGPYENETASSCNWFAPRLHPLEEWSDARAWDGTLSLGQPLVRPLRDGRTPAELLAALAGDRDPAAHRLLIETHADVDVDAALVSGLVAHSASPEIAPTELRADAIRAALDRLPPPGAELEINLLPSPTLHDGRFANNVWLQEQPSPITKLTWDNAVFLSPATARRLGLRTEDVVEIVQDGRTLNGPVMVVPGHADGAASLWLGYGRRGAESIATNVGFDAYPLRTRGDFSPGARLIKKGNHHALATTQMHFSMEAREIALTTTRTEYARRPDFASALKHDEASLMPPVERTGPQWAMSIDLSLCTGCSACMLACQSENNLPVVGKRNLMHRRQMHWLRIDTYFHGAPAAPRAVHQPMMCQHCEAAPCEYVCPVNATVHSTDGLNEMVYNRCVGTRFCSNNCPYKVRRFNWFNWFKREPAFNGGELTLAHNPDVTVRDRGVMEKCTYCVQRIRGAEIRARRELREIAPGEVVTACQQACPTSAIQFGSLTDGDSEMVRWRHEARAYGVLQDQGTRPRTQYLARIDNPNPELE
jgi:molybdopterin-containing oxidoreductase family iron-sulfur binding subunit